jgi:polysaccharide deacetylase family protein (PEP-CTERM system associated)
MPRDGSAVVALLASARGTGGVAEGETGSLVKGETVSSHGPQTEQAMNGRQITNALTIDFEDWYHGLEIPQSRWDGFERRIEQQGRKLLEIFSQAGVRATFFVLGRVAEQHPQVVKEIAAAGHEIGTHGLAHEFIYRMTPGEFREGMKRSIQTLAELTGMQVLGHRAAYFSITRQSLWALDILRDMGIRYDSSIFPVLNYRYGIENAPRWPYAVYAAGRPLTEFPLSTVRFFRRNIPVAGGAYFRIYPYAVSRSALRSINRQEHPFTFYLHPWEIDPGHPRIALPRRVALTHYFNLSATEGRVRRLLGDFSFAPMKEVLNVG